MSLFGSLEIGKKSMSVAQTGQHTTGHNIANVDTEGFSRQEVVQETAMPAVAGKGQGADVQTIRRIQDGFTKDKVVGEQTQVGSWDTREKVLKEVEAIYTDLEGTKLRSSLDEFWSAWNTLAHEPESGPMRKALITKADALTQQFQVFDRRLSELRGNLNARVSGQILEVNQLTTQIAELNKQVEQLENRGRPANDARDMREKLLQQLSEIMEVRSFENERGNLEVQIKNGSTLVHGRQAYNIQALKSAETGDDVMLGLTGPTGLVTDVTHFVGGGSIKELIEQRDLNCKKFQDNINTIAKELVFRVNGLHSGGTGIKGLKAHETSAYSLNQDALKNPLPFLQTGSFALTVTDKDGNPEQTVSIAVEAGKDSVQDLVDKINVAAGAYEKDSQGNMTLKEKTPFKAVLNPEGSLSLESDMGRQFYFDGDNTNFFSVMGFNSFFHGINGAKDMAVNAELKEDEWKIAAGSGLIPSDNRIAVAIGELQTSAVLEDGTMSFDEYYNGQVTEVGLLTQDAQKGAKSHNQMLEQYEAMRDSISAVNIDEEMANMVKYQRAYESSAKYLSTIDEMTQTVINM